MRSGLCRIVFIVSVFTLKVQLSLATRIDIITACESLLFALAPSATQPPVPNDDEQDVKAIEADHDDAFPYIQLTICEE